MITKHVSMNERGAIIMDAILFYINYNFLRRTIQQRTEYTIMYE